MQVQDGGRTQVTCSISSGDLPIKVSWTRDGRPIAANLNVEMQTGEFHSLLIFKKLRGEHSGVYTCTARNLAKAASHSAVLLVQGPSSFFFYPKKEILRMTLFCSSSTEMDRRTTRRSLAGKLPGQHPVPGAWNAPA